MVKHIVDIPPELSNQLISYRALKNFKNKEDVIVYIISLFFKGGINNE